MKFLVVLAIAVACASADVGSRAEDVQAPILRYNNDNAPDGSFQYAYETGNKIAAEASGVVKNPNSEYPALEVNGRFAYVSPDGTPIETTYVANENGFQPSGNHIPVAPEIPELIARSLRYIADHPPKVERVPGRV